jgi:hypothetical protein
MRTCVRYLGGLRSGAFHPRDQAGELWDAERAARELRGLGLYDALDLCALIARHRPDRLERAALRWHGRLELGSRPIAWCTGMRISLEASDRGVRRGR